MGKLKIFLIVLVVLLLAANFKDIAEKFDSKMHFDHSNVGIDVVDSETEEVRLGEYNLEEEDGKDAYYLEPSISFREKVFCRGGAGKAASCRERPISPYWESWANRYGSPDQDDSIAKQKYTEKYKGHQKVKRTEK